MATKNIFALLDDADSADETEESFVQKKAAAKAEQSRAQSKQAREQAVRAQAAASRMTSVKQEQQSRGAKSITTAPRSAATGKTSGKRAARKPIRVVDPDDADRSQRPRHILDAEDLLQEPLESVSELRGASAEELAKEDASSGTARDLSSYSDIPWIQEHGLRAEFDDKVIYSTSHLVYIEGAGPAAVPLYLKRSCGVWDCTNAAASSGSYLFSDRNNSASFLGFSAADCAEAGQFVHLGIGKRVASASLQHSVIEYSAVLLRPKTAPVFSMFRVKLVEPEAGAWRESQGSIPRRMAEINADGSEGARSFQLSKSKTLPAAYVDGMLRAAAQWTAPFVSGSDWSGVWNFAGKHSSTKILLLPLPVTADGRHHAVFLTNDGHSPWTEVGFGQIRNTTLPRTEGAPRPVRQLVVYAALIQHPTGERKFNKREENVFETTVFQENRDAIRATWKAWERKFGFTRDLPASEIATPITPTEGTDTTAEASAATVPLIVVPDVAPTSPLQIDLQADAAQFFAIMDARCVFPAAQPQTQQ
eukprot:TRINITY_DN5084_c0_g1_i1.p2 TRINITY_DN5084_c0_g1~~TRINITY_DN5084_c0_g1_i1.p2  ORF type:complete len:534 (-),score=152.73 TRINITY_DN5084_c0_g1_i1:1813-3414(-)